MSDYLESFRAAVAGLRDGEGLPRFVEQECRDFLRTAAIQAWCIVRRSACRGGFFIVRLTRSYDSWVRAAWVDGQRTAVRTRLRLSRFRAHAAQRVGDGTAMSTRRVAICAHHVFGALVTALRIGAGLLGALRRGLAYLLANAQRVHPARDRRTGRLCAGLALVEPA